MKYQQSDLELTILMPCLNEAETLEQCIRRARALLDVNNIKGEILVSDNGSTDGSQEIAKMHGAKVVHCATRGYGAALQNGILHSNGRFILMGDADDSYHFDEAMPMIEMLRNGADVCMGNRLQGRIMDGAMPFLNRYLGNPALTAIGKTLFHADINDFHCGMRAFRKDKILSLELVTTGMEWASEMVIKSRLARLEMSEVPIALYRDGRNRKPHLRRWRDGWRHLRFMLLYSPRWLFLIPGIILTCLGGIFGTALLSGPISIGSVSFDTNTLLVCSMAMLIGFQLIVFAVFTKMYAMSAGYLPRDIRVERVARHFRLEQGLAIGLTFLLVGLSLIIVAVKYWQQHEFGAISYPVSLRLTIPGVTIVTLGVQVIFSSFFLSILGIRSR